MGGTCWGYWAPYADGDVERALQAVRASVFATGEYHLRHLGFGPDFDSLQEEWDEEDDPEERAAYEAEFGVQDNDEPWRNRRPVDIDDLLIGNAEDGTHTIIDMDGVSETPAWGKVAPLSESDIVRVFGSLHPDRATIESKENELQSLRARWFGTYVVAYDGTKPVLFHCSGCSGD